MHKKQTSARTPIRISSAPSRRKVEWQLLVGDELARDGATLINLILAAATDRGISMQDIGPEALGVSKSYFHQLRAGAKPMSGLGEEHIAKAASFLRWPKISVMLAAGQLKLEDFYADPATFHEFLVPALKHIQRDPELGPSLPPEIFKADPAIQQYVVMLYERVANRSLIPGKVSNETIAERHRTLLQSGDSARRERE